MNRAKTARWVSRLVALGMLIAALAAFKLMESQLRHLGESAARVEERRPSSVEAPPVASTRLPAPRPPAGGDPIADELDSKVHVPDFDAEAADAPPEIPAHGEVPEGAVW